MKDLIGTLKEVSQKYCGENAAESPQEHTADRESLRVHGRLSNQRHP
jgi:hypothetical protein